MRRLDNFVGGESVAPMSKKYVELINPATGEPFAEMPVSNAADVDAALQVANAAFQSWKRTTPSQRSRALQQIADILEAHAEELVAVEAENCGKIIALTMSEEIPPMLDQIRFFAGAARLLEVAVPRSTWRHDQLRPTRTRRRMRRGHTMELPDDDGGVEVGAGDRGRQHDGPQAGRFDAGLNGIDGPTHGRGPAPGVFNVVCGDRDTGRALVEHPIPAMVSVTGSCARHGSRSSASQTLKRVHLELGGKAPVIIFDDVDIASAAENIAVAGYFNAGQDCTAATRVLVGPKVYGDFVDALAEQARNTVIGQPDNDDALFGPVNNVNQFQRVTGFLGRAPGHASVAAGGHQVGESATSSSPPWSPICAKTTR